MEMTSLKLLHRSMMEKEIEHQIFRMKIGSGEFDGFVAIGDARPVLAVVPRGSGRRIFRFEVLRGYRVDAFLGEDYHDLRDAYFGRGKSTRKLQPKDFFEALNAQMPTEATDGMVPTPDEITRMMGPDAA